MPTDAILFYLLAAIAGISAIGVLVSPNIVRMAVFLLFTLSAVAGLYLTLSAEFLAAVQLVVYVGGTLILIIFGVMLTSKLPFSRMEPKRGEVYVAIGIALLLLAVLGWGIYTVQYPAKALTIGEHYPVVRLGQVLLGDFLIPFELASVLLLVVMIGAAYLAKARRRRESEPTGGARN